MNNEREKMRTFVWIIVLVVLAFWAIYAGRDIQMEYVGYQGQTHGETEVFNQHGVLAGRAHRESHSRGVQIENDFAYYANRAWTERFAALEGLLMSKDPNNYSDETLMILEAISGDRGNMGDGSTRVRLLASSMVESLLSEGDFSQAHIVFGEKMRDAGL